MDRLQRFRESLNAPPIVQTHHVNDTVALLRPSFYILGKQGQDEQPNDIAGPEARDQPDEDEEGRLVQSDDDDLDLDPGLIGLADVPTAKRPTKRNSVLWKGQQVLIKDFLGKAWDELIFRIHNMDDPLEKPLAVAADPWPYQLHGCRVLCRMRDSLFQGGICADEMGLGKTLLMILVDIKTLGEGGTTLVVCTTSCIHQWVAEYQRHLHKAHEMKILVLTRDNERQTSAAKIQDYDVVIVAYPTLCAQYLRREKYEKDIGKLSSEPGIASKEVKVLPLKPTVSLLSEVWGLHGVKFRNVFFDEAHIIKKPTGKTHMAAKELCARAKFAVTGTPMPNQWDDIFGLVDLLKGHPFDNKNQFHQIFATIAQKDDGTQIRKQPTTQKIKLLTKFIQPMIIARPTSSLQRIVERTTHDVCFKMAKEESLRIGLYLDRYWKLKQKIEDKKRKGERFNSVELKQQRGLLMMFLQRARQCSMHYLMAPDPREDRTKDEAALILELLEGVSALSHTKPSKESKRSKRGKKQTTAKGKKEVKQSPPRTAGKGSDEQDKQAGTKMEDEFDDDVHFDAVDTVDGVNHGVEMDFDVKREGTYLALITKDQNALQSSRVGKFLKLWEVIKQRHPDEKVVVWSWSRMFLQAIKHALAIGLKQPQDCLELNGDVSRKEREAIQEAFDSVEDKRPLLITSGAGGLGLNLVSASVVVQLERWWNLALEEQAYARSARQGQKKKVHVYRMIGESSIDQQIIASSEQKDKIGSRLMREWRREDDAPIGVNHLG